MKNKFKHFLSFCIWIIFLSIVCTITDLFIGEHLAIGLCITGAVLLSIVDVFKPTLIDIIKIKK